ncbi:MAG: ubiquitin-like domain-containing protein [Anaerolineae bacterium]
MITSSFASTVTHQLLSLAPRLLRLIAGFRPSGRLLSALLALLAWGALGIGYYVTGLPVTLIVDGQPQQLRTHQATVAGLLREADILLHPEDLIAPPPDAALAANSVVQVRLARPVTVEADGQSVEVRTQHRRVTEILAEVGIRVKPRDEVLVNGQPWNLDADLPQASLDEGGRRGPGLASALSRATPVRIVLRRAVPIILTDNGVPVTLYTTRATVGEALLSQGILLYLGDHVTPSLGSRVLPSMRIYIERSTPVTISTDGRTLRTRTRRHTVGEVLAQEGIALMGKDYSLPSSDTPIVEDMAIRVVRIREALEIEQEPIPFETNWVPDPDMLLDMQQVVQPGGSGVIKRRYRVIYEDGQEVTHVMEDEWVDHAPGNKIIAYGTKITVQTLETPDGTFEYWRHFRVLATSYSAATSGKSKDHPRYGITRTGLKAGHGIIAVDPKVIPLWSEVYVPGYGKALAGDTGGTILGRHIDLGFDEDEPPLWYRWVDVYVLTPMPPADQIRYVLPNWPQEPRR